MWHRFEQTFLLLQNNQKNDIFLNSKLDILTPQWNRSVRDLQLPGAGDEGLVAVAVAIVLSLSRLLFYL